MRKIPIRPADENPSAREEPSARVGAGFLSGLRRTARWIALHELWLLAAAGPFLLFPGRWTLPAFSVIVLTWLCRWLAVGRLTVSTPVDVAIVLIVLMALIGFYASVDTSLGLPALWRIVLGVAVFYGLVNGLGSEVQLRWLPTALILCSLALALISLIGTEWSAVRLFDLPQVYAHLPSLLRDIQDQQAFHPRIMGMALVTLLPIPLALLLFAQGKRLRLLAGLTALLVGTTVALTQSLQAAFGIACAALFLGACWNRWVLVCVPLILFASVLGLQHYGLQQAANALLSLDDPLGIAVVLRLDIWSRALAMIHDMPYTGIGLDQFAVIQTNYYTGFLLGPEPHAHNLFLQVALDLGLPGLFALWWIVLGLGHAAVKAYPRYQDPDLRALLLGALAGGVSCLASGLLDTIWTAKPAFLLWLLLGVVAALSVGVGRSETPRSSGKVAVWLRRVAPLLLLLLLLYPGLLVSRVAPSLNRAAVRGHKLILQLQAGATLPRQALMSVAEDLDRAQSVDARNPQLYNLLGRVLAWLGDYQAAMEALRIEVEIDGANAFARYAPYESLRRRVTGTEDHDRWADTLRIYTHWKNRFPERAESHVLFALVYEQHQGNPEGAAEVVRSAIDRGAEPQGLLLYYLNQLDARVR
jgi:putative inorganic carbon (HCO3(-)) transporter